MNVKKGLVVAVILLFFSVSVIPSTGTTDVKQITVPTTSGDTLYVGGNGTGNYTSIQDAIDDASDGDTVYVYNGTYYENLIVNKTIDLTGKDMDKTIIDGNEIGDVVLVSADRVNISSFKIQNSGGLGEDAGIDIHSNHNTITGNNISNNEQGIRLVKSSNNTITGNTIISNYDGIWLRSFNNYNTITGNNISNNSVVGIIAYWGSSSNTIITDNTISNNMVGIQLEGSSNHNTITGNTICSNDISGIYLSGSSNILSSNTISNNGEAGICLGYYSNNNVTSNTISNNNYGIYLYSSSSNTILKNNFLDNERDAFFITSFLNQWKQNYWNESRVLPKLIFGLIKIGSIWIPWFNFDWHPAKEPYDIGV